MSRYRVWWPASIWQYDAVSAVRYQVTHQLQSELWQWARPGDLCDADMRPLVYNASIPRPGHVLADVHDDGQALISVRFPRADQYLLTDSYIIQRRHVEVLDMYSPRQSPAPLTVRPPPRRRLDFGSNNFLPELTLAEQLLDETPLSVEWLSRNCDTYQPSLHRDEFVFGAGSVRATMVQNRLNWHFHAYLLFGLKPGQVILPAEHVPRTRGQWRQLLNGLGIPFGTGHGIIPTCPVVALTPV